MIRCVFVSLQRFLFFLWGFFTLVLLKLHNIIRDLNLQAVVVLSLKKKRINLQENKIRSNLSGFLSARNISFAHCDTNIRICFYS